MRRIPARSLGVPLLVTALLCIGYLIWAPTAPDLLAQVARAGVAARAGSVGWWTGWFGGLSLPSYSVLVPSWMATVGVQVTGVAAVVSRHGRRSVAHAGCSTPASRSSRICDRVDRRPRGRTGHVRRWTRHRDLGACGREKSTAVAQCRVGCRRLPGQSARRPLPRPDPPCGDLIGFRTSPGGRDRRRRPRPARRNDGDPVSRHRRHADLGAGPYPAGGHLRGRRSRLPDARRSAISGVCPAGHADRLAVPGRSRHEHHPASLGVRCTGDRGICDVVPTMAGCLSAR